MGNTNCKFSIVYNGEMIEFNSDSELDSFLNEHADEILAIGQIDKTFSSDLQYITKSKLAEIKLDVEKASSKIERLGDDPEEYDIIQTVLNSIGTTKFITTYGDPSNWNNPISPAFNKNAWRKMKLEEHLNNGLSEEEGNKLIKLEEESWVYLTEIGTEIHGVIESVFNDTEINSELLNEDQVNLVKQQTEKFIKELKALHGENAIFYTEFALKSKNLNKSLAGILESKGITSINGRTDLLVVDSSGDIHIYDFKVSRKKVGDWNEKNNAVIRKQNAWHSTKKRNTTYQLAFYNAMLKQYNLRPVSANVLPIHIDLNYEENNITIKELNGVSFDETIRNVKGTTAGYEYNNVTSVLPSGYHGNLSSLNSTFDKFEQLFPKSSVTRQVKQVEANVEYFKNRPGFKHVIDSKSSKGKIYKYYFVEEIGNVSKTTYCIDDADFDKKLAEYVKTLNEHKSNQLIDLAYLIDIATPSTIESIGKNFSDTKQAFIINQFKKYIKNEWEFIKNEDLNAAGIFIFQNNGRTEIVSITNSALFNNINLGKGHSILGDVLNDDKWDKKKVLAASNGNLELFKILSYISENPDVFKENKISEIRSINPWHATQSTVLNSQLLENWTLLLMNKKDIKDNLDRNLFYDDVSSLVALADDKLRSVDGELVGFELLNDAVETEYNRKWFETKLLQMRQKYQKLWNLESFNASDEIWQAYMYLHNALMASEGIITYNELDSGNYLNGGLNIVGLYSSSIQYSPSINARMLGDMMNVYTTEVRSFVDEYMLPVTKAFNEFYAENGRIRAVGGEARYFLSWFEKTSDGKISSLMRVKDPNHSDFQGSPKARIALDLFLKTMARLRWGDNETKIEIAKQNGEYYNVPLLEAKFGRQVKQLDFVKAVRNKWNEYSNVITGTFASRVQEKQDFEKTSNKLYNRFDIREDQRFSLIEQHGVGFFETDIERVFRNALVGYAKTEVSKKYIPIIQGIKMSLRFKNDHGNSLENNIEFVDKYIKRKFYGEPIIEKSLLPFYGFLSVLKAGFSKMTLGLNSRSFAREFLQGSWVGLSRSGVKMIDGINLGTYTKAFTHVLQEAHKNYSTISLLQQLNSQYGMANYGLSEIADQKRTNWLGFKNMSEETLYLTSSSPDFQHRMAMWIAKAIGDGCYDTTPVEINGIKYYGAHYLDSNDKLQYDFTKDKRFSIFVSGDTNNKEYLYQKTLYLKHIEEWNKQGYDLKIDGKDGKPDPLPRAYTIEEGSRLKNFADLCYGHYDGETRAMINDTFIGSFFMQYKTFVTAKMEQWLLKPGVYNNESLQLQKDPETGEELWTITSYPNEDGTGTPSRKIVKKSEVTQTDLDSGLAEPYITWQGDPMEGIWYSMWSFGKSIFKMDQAEMNRIWNDPLRKRNLFLGLHDMAIMTLLAMLIQALFGSELLDDIKDQSWATQWSYNVLIGSTQDGPIHNVIQSMFSDLNPPMVSSVKKFVESSTKVITGNDNVWYQVTQNFGALRELQGVVRASVNN